MGECLNLKRSVSGNMICLQMIFYKSILKLINVYLQKCFFN